MQKRKIYLSGIIIACVCIKPLHKYIWICYAAHIHFDNLSSFIYYEVGWVSTNSIRIKI